MSFVKLQLDRIVRLIWYMLAMVVRQLTKVNNRKVFCWSYNFRKYACNPRAITEFILNNKVEEYEIYWAFDKQFDTSGLDRRIHVVRKYSFAYLYALYTSKFIFYNARNNPFESMFIKKKKQKYIMTWHSSIRLKRIEKDAIKQLGHKYERIAKRDSEMCDLMLSNSKMFTNLIRDSFWYGGEILESCVPRNDMFYNNVVKDLAYRNVRKSMGFLPSSKIVLYAPTFRGNSKDLKYYRINWITVIPHLERMLGGKVEVLVKLHPNMSDVYGIDTLINTPHVHNITQTPDITEFLFASDVLISDYTSAMFDFSILRKPCFIYAIDKDEYDRGFYWSFDQLPFVLAETEEQLIYNIDNFTMLEYERRLDIFQSQIWGLKEDGRACYRLYNWMKAGFN